MPDFLSKIIPSVEKRIASGYYEKRTYDGKKRSLKEAVQTHPPAVIAELKPVSPSKGRLLKLEDAVALGHAYAKAGACGLSILTEPDFFGGSLTLLYRDYGVPKLQKDFVIEETQMSEAADAVLLIQTLMDRMELDVRALVDAAHEKELEVLLEVHSLEEFKRAKKTKADLIGINNRDLRTLKTSLETTPDILSKSKPGKQPVVSESGIETRADLERVLSSGASAVLIGTSLLASPNPVRKLEQLLGKE